MHTPRWLHGGVCIFSVLYVAVLVAAGEWTLVAIFGATFLLGFWQGRRRQ